MGEVAPEVVERMVALVRDMAETKVSGASDLLFGQRDRWMTESRAIAVLLPEPVDPDMVIAREAVCRSHHDKYPGSPWNLTRAQLVRAGDCDTLLDVMAAYEAVKMTRALEQSK